MRVLTWLVGGVAAAATATYLAKRRTRQSVIDRFITALEAKQVAVLTECDIHPIAGGYEQTFTGFVARDAPFHFSACADSSRTKWTFRLTWQGASIAEHWNVLKRGRARTLAVIHLALKRLPVRLEGG